MPRSCSQLYCTDCEAARFSSDLNTAAAMHAHSNKQARCVLNSEYEICSPSAASVAAITLTRLVEHPMCVHHARQCPQERSGSSSRTQRNGVLDILRTAPALQNGAATEATTGASVVRMCPNASRIRWAACCSVKCPMLAAAAARFRHRPPARIRDKSSAVCAPA